ncbi:MAG: helix-turn-helix domain-containing protein [Brachyspira sp.]|nr:helix-turn-helix domain-containing protein [Brachyspira sp.]
MEREEIIRIFAENVRVERARRRLTQEKLAEMADITPEYLARIENERYSPSLVVIVKIALALNVSVDTLIPIKK